MATTQQVFSIKDAAARLGLTRAAVYTAIRRGRIATVPESLGRTIAADEIARYRRENLGKVGIRSK